MKKLALKAILLTSILVIVGLLYCFLYKPDSTPTHSKATLLVGLDASGKRADALYVLYTTDNGLSILGIPRDLLMPGRHKLNGLFGKYGAAGFKKVIESVVMHRIDKYVIIRMSVAASIDKAFTGGTRVVLPCEFDYQDKAGRLKYHLNKGAQRLHGLGVVYVLRDRRSGGNKGDAIRIERFKLVTRAMIDEIKRNPLILARIPAAFKQATDSKAVTTNLGGYDALSIFSCAQKGISSHHISTHPYKAKNGIWFEQADTENIQRQASIVSQGIVLPENVRIWVLNGTDIAGAGRKVATHFRDRYGIDADYGNASQHLSRTVVRYSPKDNSGLSSLSSILAHDLNARLVHDKIDSISPVINVEIGSDRAVKDIQ